MGVYTKEEQLKLINDSWRNLTLIDNQYEEICLKAVKQNSMALQFVEKQTEEICLEAVKQDGFTLKFVEKQTEEMCLEAIKNYGLAIKYVKNQTEKICLELVKYSGLLIEYVEYQTEEICLEAIKNNLDALKYIKEKTPILYFYAFLQDYTLLNYSYIENGVKRFIYLSEKTPSLMYTLGWGGFNENERKINDSIFCFNDYIGYIKNKDIVYIDINSLKYLNNYLLKENSGNKYILNDELGIDILKELALSNNELVVIDTGNIKDIQRKLANKIITIEELQKGSFEKDYFL